MSGKKEVMDSRPVEVPMHFKRPLTIQEEIKRYVRTELSMRADALEAETFDESDDFNVDDDDEVVTPYELTPMQLESRVGVDASNLERIKGDSNGKGKVGESGVVGGGSGSSGVESSALRDDVKPSGKSVAGERRGGDAAGSSA